LGPLATICLCATATCSVTIEKIRKEYDLAHYKEVISLAKEFISQGSLEPESEITARKLMAFSSVALGMNDEAEQEFEKILRLRPDFVLSPVLTSPKIVSVFKRVKQRVEREKIDHFRAPDNRIAALRSALFPGLGQLYKGEKNKGYVIVASEAVLLGATVYSHLRHGQFHDEYLRSVDPEEIERNYKEYNNWYRARLIFGGAAVAVWMYSHLDAALLEVAAQEEKHTSLLISVHPEGRNLGVHLSIPIQ